MRYEIMIIGVVISMIFTELTGFSPAGIIVPGFLVIYLASPQRIVYTLIVALISFFIVKKLGNFMILYGRRAFTVTIFVSFVVSLSVSSAINLISDLIFKYTLIESVRAAQNFQLIGSLVAGIIAREFDKQGIWQSLLALGIVMAIILTLIKVVGMVGYI